MEHRPNSKSLSSKWISSALIAWALFISPAWVISPAWADEATPSALTTAASLANQAIDAASHGPASVAPCPDEAAPMSDSTRAACGRWATQLEPLHAIDLLKSDPAAAAAVAKENLHILAPTNASLEVGAACVQGRIPNLADPRYRQAIYRTPDRSLSVSSMLGYFSTLGRSSVQNMLTQYRDLKKFRGDSDAALVAALSFRESGFRAWSASDEKLETYGSGGLDFLGANLGLMRSRYLPPGYGRSWRTSLEDTNESGEKILAAIVPQRDLPVAYGAWLLFSKDSFEKAAKSQGFSQSDLDHMSTDARRAWTAVFFAAPGGVEYGKPHRNSSLLIGGVTILSHLKALIEAKKAKNVQSRGLDDILSSPELYQYVNVRAAVAVAGNAALLERRLGLQ